MTPDVLLVLGAVFTCFLLVVWFVNKRLNQLSSQQKPSDELLEYLKTTNVRLEDQTKRFDQSLHQNTQALNERLDNAAKVIYGVQRSLGEMSEIGRNMKDLQEFLRSPKLRGNVGEQVLKELLSQMLPKQSFHLQFTFKSGNKVDAAIDTAAGKICIDSKFPMENFRKMMSVQTDEEKKEFERAFVRDVKGHIDAISKKYILTDEGTIDYALMYLPSEAVYYEIVNSMELFDYAGKKCVMPVSPSTFFAFLKAIMMSFEGQKIEAQAREILAAIKAIQKDYTKVGDNLSVLQKHVTNASNTMTTVFSSFNLLGQKITATQSLGHSREQEEIKQLETPEIYS